MTPLVYLYGVVVAFVATRFAKRLWRHGCDECIEPALVVGVVGQVIGWLVILIMTGYAIYHLEAGDWSLPSVRFEP